MLSSKRQRNVRDTRLTTIWWWVIPSQIVINCMLMVLVSLVIEQLLQWPTFWLWFLELPLLALNGVTIWGWFAESQQRKDVARAPFPRPQTTTRPSIEDEEDSPL